jgi:hypothetical protein
LVARAAPIAPGLYLYGCTTYPLAVHEEEVIQGPKQPGNDIQLYLGLLMEELAMLWDTPPNTWDAVAQDYLPIRSSLVMMVHDYLGCGYVSGQVVHGYCACIRCMDDTTYHQLQKDPGSSKTVFLGH